MSEDKKRALEAYWARQNSLLDEAIAKELIERKDLLPPWQKYPDIPYFSTAWRMGSPEWYLMMWHRWARGMDQAKLLAYFKQYKPVPVEWYLWTAATLGNDDFEDLIAGGAFKGIRWLEHQGLADFSEFMSWYQAGQEEVE